MSDDENTLKVLKILEKHPELTQRELAAELGVSLGKTHYLLKSLVDIGLVKLDNFQRSNNKWGYAYLLGVVASKTLITAVFDESESKSLYGFNSKSVFAKSVVSVKPLCVSL